MCTVCMCMHVCIQVHPIVCAGVGDRGPYQVLFPLFFEAGSLSEPEAHHIKETGWLTSLWGSPVSASLAREL